MTSAPTVLDAQDDDRVERGVVRGRPPCPLRGPCRASRAAVEADGDGDGPRAAWGLGWTVEVWLGLILSCS
jgi:hypothetical protein